MASSASVPASATEEFIMAKSVDSVVLPVGTEVILKAGTAIGMAKLKKDCKGIIDQHQKADDGSTFYGVEFYDGKRMRHTWWKP